MNVATIDQTSIYTQIAEAGQNGERLLSILIDPENVAPAQVITCVKRLPPRTTHLLVGGSTASRLQTQLVVEALKKHTELPIILFPGSYDQITPKADALLFLSLLSGRNPEYLIGQQLKAVPELKKLSMEIIPVAYLLINGGRISSVERESGTRSMCTNDVESIVNTALAGQFSGKKLIYLEAGSGALNPVPKPIVKAVFDAVGIPIIVGGGIRNSSEIEAFHSAGAAMVVIGTAFEENSFAG